MSIGQKDRNILWGRSGGLCAICKTQLTDGENSLAYLLGEQAHIVAEKIQGPRGNSTLSLEDRNCYSNLILLCANDHTRIDKNELYWTINKLHSIKIDHEQWVSQALNLKHNETINTRFSYLTSSAVNLCSLNNWNDWTYHVLLIDSKWERYIIENIIKFREIVSLMIWPEGFLELKRSAIVFSLLLLTTVNEFKRYAESNDDFFFAVKFYKKHGDFYSNPNYNTHCLEYDNWIYNYHSLIRESNKALNWFAAEVRKSFNPNFFILQKFNLFSYNNNFEFTEDEKKIYINKFEII